MILNLETKMNKKSKKSKLLLAAGLVLAVSAGIMALPPKETCKQGFVWREAVKGDYVCVTPQTRSQAQKDNESAMSRIQKKGGAYGKDTCRKGYVWREVNRFDHVCVTPDIRSQAAKDNAEHRMRVEGGSSTVQKDVTSVPCPLQTIEMSITTRFPDPWWQTPQGGSLTKASVEKIGGKSVLVCIYKINGSEIGIMREFPEGISSCTAGSSSFRCQ